MRACELVRRYGDCSHKLVPRRGMRAMSMAPIVLPGPRAHEASRAGRGFWRIDEKASFRGRCRTRGDSLVRPGAGVADYLSLHGGGDVGGCDRAGGFLSHRAELRYDVRWVL